VSRSLDVRLSPVTLTLAQPDAVTFHCDLEQLLAKGKHIRGLSAVLVLVLVQAVLLARVLNSCQTCVRWGVSACHEQCSGRHGGLGQRSTVILMCLVPPPLPAPGVAESRERHIRVGQRQVVEHVRRGEGICKYV
jgi:hypothetical protein